MTKPKNTKVFDVAKPGKSTPDTSGKSIIVTNRPVLQDPMVVANDTSSDNENVPGETPSSSTSSAVAPPSSSHIKLQPLTTPAESDSSSDSITTSAAEDTYTTTSADSTSTESSDTDDTPADAATSKQDADSAELAARKEAERLAKLDEIAESHKYYLPINQVEKRRNKRYAVVGAILIIILGLAWADIALDAGLITINGITAPTHFFK